MPSAQSPLPPSQKKKKILLILAKTAEKKKLNFSRSALFHIKTRVSLKYFVNGCRNCLACSTC